MNKRYYEHTLPIIRGSLSNTYRKSSYFRKIVNFLSALLWCPVSGKSMIGNTLSRKGRFPIIHVSAPDLQETETDTTIFADK